MKAETDTVMQLARRGDLPGAKLGKRWVFMREDVLAFVRKKIDDDTLRRRQDSQIPAVGLLMVKPAHGRIKPRPVLPGFPQ